MVAEGKKSPRASFTCATLRASANRSVARPRLFRSASATSWPRGSRCWARARVGSDRTIAARAAIPASAARLGSRAEHAELNEGGYPHIVKSPGKKKRSVPRGPEQAADHPFAAGAGRFAGVTPLDPVIVGRSEEHTSELQSRF